MPQQKNAIQCLANKYLVKKLRDDENNYIETQKDRLVMTFRRAIRSIMDCSIPIRCKEDALKLKGIGEFVAARIESHLRKADLLNVAPLPIDLEAEVLVRPVKKADICKYVPRSGGGIVITNDRINRIAAHLVLISTVKCTCELKKKSILQEEVDRQVTVISPSTNLLSVKFRETIRLLCSKKLIWEEGEMVGLTPQGSQLGSICLEESRLNYTAIEEFIKDGKLLELSILFPTISIIPSTPMLVSTSVPPSCISPSPLITTSTLSLPRLVWPLSAPPSTLLYAESIEEQESDETPVIDNSPIPGKESDWEVLLVLDIREIRNQQDRQFLQNHLQQIGVNCDVRNLGLGDMQWVLYNQTYDKEIMLNTIVERKNTRDLASSIIDGRFNEQQYRLLQCGCSHPVYLIEGGLRSQDIMPADHLQTNDTVVFLKGLHERVKASIKSYFESGDESCFHPRKLCFSEFQSLYSKSRETDLRHLWCQQLRQIPRCTVPKIQAITTKYPTLACLMKAYSELSTIKEKEDLLKLLCDRKGTVVGPSLSRNIFHSLCG